VACCERVCLHYVKDWKFFSESVINNSESIHDFTTFILNDEVAEIVEFDIVDLDGFLDIKEEKKEQKIEKS